MNSATPEFVIVVGIDFSDASKRVFMRALEEGHRRGNTEVHAVAVSNPDDPLLAYRPGFESLVPTDALARLQAFASEHVREQASRIGALQIRRVVTHLELGSPADVLVRLAAQLDADLIVVGTHGRRGVERLLLGSVAERVLRTAGCPVLVDRAKKHDVAAREPAIEPPCPDCVQRRAESGGKEFWCERHAEHHAHAHIYSSSEGVSSSMRPWGFST
jgi:nucleotide-binding universal stress UspA family protein